MQVLTLGPDIDPETGEFILKAVRKTQFRDDYRGDAFQAAKLLMQPGATLATARRGVVTSEPNGGSLNVCLGTVTIDGVVYADPVVNIRKKDAHCVTIADQEVVTDRPHSYGKCHGTLLRVVQPIELLQVQRGIHGRPIRALPTPGSLWSRDAAEIVASLESMGKVLTRSLELTPAEPKLLVMVPESVFLGDDGSWYRREKSLVNDFSITCEQAEEVLAASTETAGGFYVPISFVSPAALYKFRLVWDVRGMQEHCLASERVVVLGSGDYPEDSYLRYGELFFKVPARPEPAKTIDPFAWMR